MNFDGALTLIALIAGAAWTYGSSGPRGRRNFRRWVNSHKKRAQPHTKIALIKLLALILFIGTGSISYESASGIYSFREGTEPATRKEIVALLAQAFNMIMYGLAAYTSLLVLITSIPKKKIPLVLTEGKPSSFFIQGRIDPTKLEQALKDGVTVTLSVDKHNNPKIAIDKFPSITITKDL